MSELILKEEFYKILGTCFDVYNELGAGFLESVYEEALGLEFEVRKIPFLRQWGIDVYYKGEMLHKKFYADFLCFDEIIIELKAKEYIAPEHEAQLINYLKATKKKLGILVNFGGNKLQYKRLANTKNI